MLSHADEQPDRPEQSIVGTAAAFREGELAGRRQDEEEAAAAAGEEQDAPEGLSRLPWQPLEKQQQLSSQRTTCERAETPAAGTRSRRDSDSSFTSFSSLLLNQKSLEILDYFYLIYLSL